MTATVEFMKKKETLSDKAFFLTTVAYHAAPTLLAGKASTLMSFTRSGRNTYSLWHQFAALIKPYFGLSSYVLRTSQNAIGVLLFYPQRLLDVLMEVEHHRFLLTYGYSQNPHLSDMLHQLKARFDPLCPAEIGVFLGYPLADVQGFMRCHGKDYLISGYWKVYHQPFQALETFSTYRKAQQQVACGV